MAKRSLSSLDDLLIYTGAFMVVFALVGGSCLGLATRAGPAHDVTLNKPDGTTQTRTHFGTTKDLKERFPNAISIKRHPNDKKERGFFTFFLGFFAVTFG